MPVRTPLLAATALLLAGACAGAAADPPPSPPAIDPVASAEPPAPEQPEAAAEEISLTIPVGTTPDGVDLEIVVRSVEVGDRREVVLVTPDGVADHQVIDGDDHWFWIPPSARELAGGVQWVHLDVAEIATVGELPDLVADARVPLPRPGDLAVGVEVAGHEVVDVRHVSPDEDVLDLAGLDEPAVLRRRSLPATTGIDLPAGAVDLRDLPEAVGW